MTVKHRKRAFAYTRLFRGKFRQLPLCGFLLLLLVFSCTGVPPSDKVSKPSTPISRIPITRKGKMSTTVLALVERQNFIFDGKQTYTYPDGLAFYFVIYPSEENGVPSIKQYQNFTIDGELYWQNASGAYDSYTVIYNARTFEEQETAARAKINIRKSTPVFIQKTVICGAPLPSQGIVSYLLFFGFGQTLEEFEFRFNLKNVVGQFSQ
ncbi:MAG: hypothetical protein LBC31_05585 [Treponema sp.]|jgi:hypothetical protein|nr:hypothetical protein [Treponema sp.]